MNEFNFCNFETAARATLAFLHKRLGFDLWMVTRTEGDDWIVLQVEDHGYGVRPGTVFRWADSFCSEMVKGNGPCIAPRSDSIPAYAAAPIGRQVKIGAYVGVPLLREGGGLFGTLCAIHPSSQPDSIAHEQELVELLGAMLSNILNGELKASEEARRSERLQAEAMTDAMTNLYNRRGWDQLLASEEERCLRFGHPAVVMIIDLDGLKNVNDSQGHAAGDALIIRAAAALRKATRSLDVIARLGGDEFGILSPECDRAGGNELLTRVRDALCSEGVHASIGLAIRSQASGLKGACDSADNLMYVEKRSR